MHETQQFVHYLGMPNYQRINLMNKCCLFLSVFCLILLSDIISLILIITLLSGTEGSKSRPASVSEFGTIRHSTGFRSDDAGELGRSM